MPPNARELGVVRLARPCRMTWTQLDRIDGERNVRFCSRCEKNVYNLSALDSTDARALLLAREGKLCVRFWARADGTVVTRDCPRSMPRWLSTFPIFTALAGVLLSYALFLFGDNMRRLFSYTDALGGDAEVVERHK